MPDLAGLCMSRCSSSRRTWNLNSNEVVPGISPPHAMDVAVSAPHLHLEHITASPLPAHIVEAAHRNAEAHEAGASPRSIRKKLRAPICVKLTLFICLSVCSISLPFLNPNRKKTHWVFCHQALTCNVSVIINSHLR